MARENNIQPTEKQKRAAENVIKQKLSGENVNYGKALLDAGYSNYVSKSPPIVTKSKGYQYYLDKHDLTHDSIAGLIKQTFDILPPRSNFNYIQLVARMRGMLDSNVNLNVTQSDEGLDMLAKLLASEKDEQDT